MNDSKDQAGDLIIGEGVSVTGTFDIPKKAVVNGTVNGELTASELIVGPMGKITGKTSANNADIHGETHDTLTVSQHLILRGTGKIHGRATYGELEIERGGFVAGTIGPESQGSSGATASSVSVSAPSVAAAPAVPVKSPLVPKVDDGNSA